MSIASKIEELLAEAAPLRLVPEDDPASLPLAGIIDHINELRAIQAAPGFVDSEDLAIPEKRKPGRPRKHGIEGADA